MPRVRNELAAGPARQTLICRVEGHHIFSGSANSTMGLQLLGDLGVKLEYSSEILKILEIFLKMLCISVQM
ncbi:MAG: hypothetical protein ACI3XG_09920 [Faecousia sp.]